MHYQNDLKFSILNTFVVHLEIMVGLGKSNTGYGKATARSLGDAGKSIFELHPKS